MNTKELKEMQHIAVILKRLQEVQRDLYAHPSLTMDIELGGYKHALNICVRIGVDFDSVGPTERTEMFTIAPWQNYQYNEDICNGIIALVKAHAARIC